LECSENELMDKVQEHFVKDLTSDPKIILDKFLKLKKEDRDDLMNNKRFFLSFFVFFPKLIYIKKRPSTRKNPKFT